MFSISFTLPCIYRHSSYGLSLPGFSLSAFTTKRIVRGLILICFWSNSKWQNTRIHLTSESITGSFICSCSFFISSSVVSSNCFFTHQLQRWKERFILTLKSKCPHFAIATYCSFQKSLEDIAPQRMCYNLLSCGDNKGQSFYQAAITCAWEEAKFSGREIL